MIPAIYPFINPAMTRKFPMMMKFSIATVEVFLVLIILVGGARSRHPQNVLAHHVANVPAA